MTPWGGENPDCRTFILMDGENGLIDPEISWVQKDTDATIVRG